MKSLADKGTGVREEAACGTRVGVCLVRAGSSLRRQGRAVGGNAGGSAGEELRLWKYHCPSLPEEDPQILRNDRRQQHIAGQQFGDHRKFVVAPDPIRPRPHPQDGRPGTCSVGLTPVSDGLSS